jgi:2-polyprenyl-3-methyl-5-hydroxy-6-metoxy-1,4-benzoquinol methylase
MTYTIEKLAERYDVSREFVRVILNKQNVLELSSESLDIDAFIRATGDAWKYIAYSLGTNQRAKVALDRMFALGTPNRIGTALDIGCGYGGFVKAFLSRGFDAYGVEIDKDLADLAELNLAGINLTGRIYVGDLFSGALSLGTFDLITVNDVIEHLPNPIGAFNMLAKMLNPGGMLGIYAPNGKSIFYAASDPHNRVFGSSILPGPLAKAYVQEMLNATGYGLGEYFELDHYRDLSKRNELNFCFQGHDGGERPENSFDYLSDFTTAFRNSGFRSRVSPLVARSVEIAIWEYISDYSIAASRAVTGSSYCDFNDQYLTRAWTIVCKKAM